MLSPFFVYLGIKFSFRDMHRIVFTGAQGTGKTTVLDEFKNRGFKVITEVVRQLSKQGVKINKDGDEDGQTKILDVYKELLSEVSLDGYISDRCMVDVLAYSMYLAEQGKVTDEFVQEQKEQLVKFKNENPDIAYCYFPIEFDVVADGVRDTDEDFRAAIDHNIKAILQEVGIQPIIVKGTVEERTAKVQRVINWLHEGIALFLEGVDQDEEIQS
jgi:predicted ATPase